MDTFECLLEKLESQGIESNILDDRNCIVSATPCDHHTSRLLEICNVLQYQQLIDQPTRITKDSSTTIDLFLINDATKLSHYGVSEIGISDHNSIYAI